MATLSILLSVMAILHQVADTTVAVPDGYVPADGSATEVSASDLETRLGAANRASADTVRLQIAPMHDTAYQPAYDVVPKYADYHYSVWGEYAELGTAAIGDVGAKLEETLFGRLESRLESVGDKLDEVFSSTFQAEIEKERVFCFSRTP